MTPQREQLFKILAIGCGVLLFAGVAGLGGFFLLRGIGPVSSTPTASVRVITATPEMPSPVLLTETPVATATTSITPTVAVTATVVPTATPSPTLGVPRTVYTSTVNSWIASWLGGLIRPVNFEAWESHRTDEIRASNTGLTVIAWLLPIGKSPPVDWRILSASEVSAIVTPNLPAWVRAYRTPVGWELRWLVYPTPPSGNVLLNVPEFGEDGVTPWPESQALLNAGKPAFGLEPLKTEGGLGCGNPKLVLPPPPATPTPTRTATNPPGTLPPETATATRTVPPETPTAGPSPTATRTVPPDTATATRTATNQPPTATRTATVCCATPSTRVPTPTPNRTATITPIFPSATRTPGCGAGCATPSTRVATPTAVPSNVPTITPVFREPTLVPPPSTRVPTQPPPPPTSVWRGNTAVPPPAATKPKPTPVF